jgi:hypothetical protein
VLSGFYSADDSGDPAAAVRATNGEVSSTTLGIGAGIDLNLSWKGRKVKTRTAVLVAIVSIGAFVPRN